MLALACSFFTAASAQTIPAVNFNCGTLTSTGQASATTWQSVTFPRSFNGAVPVVVAGPFYSADGEPHAVRVRSVTAAGFQWQIDEWDYLGGGHAGTMTGYYFAMTEGTHVFGTQRWQVGRTTTANRADSTIALTGFTAAPTVLTQVYTTNNLIATDNPRALKTRNSEVTAASFKVNLETQQSYTTAISNESVGYIAVSQGIGYLDGKVLWTYSPENVGHTLVTFYTGPFTNPLVIAQTQTKNDTEPGDLRLTTVPSLVSGQTRVQLSFKEETSSNADLTHAAETVAGLFIGDMPGEAQAKVHFANASITQASSAAWTKVNLPAAYTTPIVVFGPLSRAETTAANVRVRNVLAADPANSNRASFEYQVDEWDFQNGSHSAETVSYMVMEEGVFAVGGQVVQAWRATGVTNTPSTEYVAGDYWSSDIYYEREPAIFAQCVTTAEASSVVARVDSVDTVFDYPMNFRLRLTEAENADQTHAPETVHFIVFPGGQARFMNTAVTTTSGLRFNAGITNTLNSTLSGLSFPNYKYVQPSVFGAVQGTLAATIVNDGYHQTSAAADTDPVTIRQSGLNESGFSWIAEEDASPSAPNNTHTTEVGAWLVLAGAADADGDGVTDAIETQMGTSSALATSPNNASGGVATDLDTLKSLQSLTITPAPAATPLQTYERQDKTIASPITQNATIQVWRTVGTMPLTLPVATANGTADPTKGNAATTDYTLTGTGLSGATLAIAANQGTAASRINITVTPVQDLLVEVPENRKITFGPTVAPRDAYVRISDAIETNPANRQLYVAYLARGAGAVSNGSGIATVQLEGNNDMGLVSVNVGGLTSNQINTYLRVGTASDLRNNLGVGQINDVEWFIRYAPSVPTDQAVLSALDGGQVHCDIGTANYPGGEITGLFNRTSGTTIFDPNRPDLVAPTLPGSLTAAQAERDIYRFLDQCTMGATTALYTEIKTEVEAVETDHTLTNGCTSTDLLTGYTNWLNKQMDPVQAPNPKYLTLVMAADNEEFALRGTKPLYAGNDQQFAGAGYAASYDTYGNITNPYATGSNNAYAFNTPNGAGGNPANRRREWWTLVLQSKAQVRQRFTTALAEILVISENDTTAQSRHYGLANYWDMLADNAFGKYRDLLEDVTYSPMMGVYLSHLRNRAAYTTGNVDIFPDENYAREIMQLFTIGLVQRHPDGSLVLSASTGLPIPTYDQADITELARVMTGLCHGARHASVPVTRTSSNGYNNVITTGSVGQVELQTVNYTDFSSGSGEAFYQAPWLYPMKALGRYNGIVYHDFGAKTLFAGKTGVTTIPAQNLSGMNDLQTHPLADVDLTLAHNALAGSPASSAYNGHPNTPQFISRELIQRLVTSNPSAGYLYRVSQVWRSTNGNLGAVMKAILLDYEARALSVADSFVSAGKMKEPLVQFASFLRAFKASSGAPISTLNTMSTGFSGVDSAMLGSYPSTELAKFPAGATRLRINDLTNVIGQSPQKAPSVFNWYLPDYIQPGIMADAGLYGPELQINTESTLISRMNRHYNIALMGITGGTPGYGLDDFFTNSANMAAQLLTSTTTLIFDSTNWSVPQSVTVYGLDNGLDDGTRTTSIMHTVASTDPKYSTTYSPPINFTVNDNDNMAAKLVAITQTNGACAVVEGGAADTYKVVLTSAPASGQTVTVTPAVVQPWQVASAVASSDVTITPASITFTTSNWNTPQTFTVTAADDAVANSYLVANAPLNVRTAVVRHTVTSGDPGYNGSQVSDFNCPVTDNDLGVNRRFIPTKATTGGIPVVTEGSTTDTYTVNFGQVLPHVPYNAPTADVTLTITYDSTRVALSSTDSTWVNGGTGTATLTFTAANSTTAKTITVSGSGDTTYQGMLFSTITHATTSSDANFNGLNCAPVRVRVNDNDSAGANGISVVHTWGSSNVVENGMTDTYFVVLDRAPSANVALAWAGNDGDVSGIASLTFTTANWNVPQVITVAGRNDLRVENTQNSLVKYTASGGGYTNVKTFTVSVGDDDLNSAAGITVTQSGGTTAATEGGATDTVAVLLTGAPNNDVVVTSTSNSQLSLANSVLTFTPQNWNTAQNVTVTAANDTVAEGTHTALVRLTAASNDARYNNYVMADVPVTITDNETGPRLVLAHTSGSTNVTEGGATDTFTVAFAGGAAPAANVVVSIAGSAQATVSPATLTFTPANYTTAQTVTVTAVNDTTADPPAVAAVTASTDGSQPATYTNLAGSLNVNVYDNDDYGNYGVNTSSAISFVATNGSTRVLEGGMSDTVSVVLRKAPTDDVVLTPSYNVDSQISMSPATLTFTPANWNIPQVITVSAVNDTLIEGPQTVNLVLTSNTSGGYLNTNTGTLAVSVGDNETGGPSVVIAPSGNTVVEGGATISYTVVLGAAPATGATVRVAPTAYVNNATTTTQVTFAPTSVSFTSANFSVPQTITVTANNDAIAEADLPSGLTIVNTTAITVGADVRYNGMVAADIVTTVNDNDTGARIVAAATGGGTVVTEGGSQDTLSVSLIGSLAPSGNVVVTGTTNSQLSISPPSLTFTPANWNTPQTVTVTAVDDTVSEAVTYDNITFATNTSQPAGFTSLSTVATTNTLDNDEISAISAISVIQTNGATRVTEAGMTDTIEIVLRRAPAANVTLTPSYSSASQISVNAANYVFTPTNWNVPQTVTITAVEDATVENNHSVNLIFTSNNSGGYVTGDTVLQTVSIGDNEASNPSVTVATSGSATEGGTTGTLTVTLGAIPSSGATVRVTPTVYLLNATTTSQVTFSPAYVDFNTTTWATPQNITVTATNDAIAEPATAVTIVSSTSIPSGTDNRYNGMVANDVAFTVNDNDTTVGRINIAHVDTTTVLTEDAGTDTVAISLAGPAPATNVTVNLARALSDMRFLVSGTALDSTTLTFTPTNYANAQLVNLVVIADTGSEGVETETLTATTTSSAPANWTSLTSTLPVRVLDSDDMIRSLINIIPTGGSTGVVEGGATDTYQVVLRRAPTATVTLGGNYNNTQVTVSPANLTFTSTNWNVPQTVTVTAVDDPEVENLHSTPVTYIASYTGGYLPSDQAVVTVNISDNETTGAALITAAESGGYTWLKESTTLTATDNYTLALGVAPTSNVTITPRVNNPLSTTTNLVSFSPASVTFTPANWSTPQTVTINLAPSSTDNGTRAVFVGHSVSTTDASYRAAITPNVNAIISDANSTTAAVVTVPTGPGTSVYEGTPGNSDTVYVFLRRPPNAGTSVTVTPSLNNNTTPFAAITGQVSFTPATLTFTDTNWNTPQILTITATNDAVAEGPLSAILVCTPSAGNGYAATNTNGTTFAVTVNDNDAAGQLTFSQPTPSLLEGGAATYTIALSAVPTAPVTVTIVTQKHAVPQPAYALQAGYFSNAATGSNLQKDNMLFDWTELTTIYTTAYTAGLGGPESATTAPNGHRAGAKAVIDKLDQLWGGGWMKSKWPDGAPVTDNPRELLIQGILNCYSTTTLSTDATNFPAQVRDRCRFAAHLVSVSPTAITSH
ncbi:MAG: DUF1800 family protein [Prosthecobacter sp.]